MTGQSQVAIEIMLQNDHAGNAPAARFIQSRAKTITEA
jgi:hypothetical protein